MELLNNSIFLLLIVIITGDLIGKAKIGSFSFGPSCTVFTGLFFGYLGYKLPTEFQTFGLVLFIYSVALTSGSGALSSFRKNGLGIVLGAALTTGTGLAAALLCSYYFGFDKSTTAGLFAGSLTSTPGLAVSIDAPSVDAVKATASYAVTYTGGILLVILFIQLLPKVLKLNIKTEEETLETEMLKQNPKFTRHHVLVTNPNIIGLRVDELCLKDIAPVVITRVLRKGAEEPILANAATIMEEGDKLRIVGTEGDLKKAEMLLGKPIDEEIAFNRALTKKSILVSKASAVGATLAQLNVAEVFNVQVARITRNGIDLPASHYMRFRMGDILHVVGDEKGIQNISKMLGNDLRQTFTITLLPTFLGLAAGMAIGSIPIVLPFVGEFNLGTTGGVLLAGIVLSSLHKTGPIYWGVSSASTTMMRDLGLYCFMAVIGVNSGALIGPTIAEQGASLILSGAFVTLAPMIICTTAFYSVKKMPFLRILGLLTGSMSSTPGLAAASTISNTSFAASTYAATYPLGLLFTILLMKVLVYAI